MVGDPMEADIIIATLIYGSCSHKGGSHDCLWTGSQASVSYLVTDLVTMIT